MPNTRRTFWEAKLNGNVARDKRVIDELTSLGWRVVTVWECELTNEVNVAKRFVRALKKEAPE